MREIYLRTKDLSVGYHGRPLIRDIRLELPELTGKTARALNGGKVKCESKEDKLIISMDVLNEYEAIIME